MHLHIDCHFGMAGDMLLAALIDAGASEDAIREKLRALPLEDFSLVANRTARGGVASMLVDVDDLTETEPGAHTHDHHHDGEPGQEREHDGGHSGGHAHGHPHDHDHDAPHEHGHHGQKARRRGPHRHLGDLLKLLEGDAISPRAKERAGTVFRILAEAEATVHGMTLERVHFHEISGIDTAVDVIGVCIALDLLEIDDISAAPPSVGSGMVMCEHGIFPVPAPATLEILKTRNMPWRPGGDGERATPTGVALLAGLADAFGDSPEITVTRIGYGAGHRDFPDVPNLLRVIIGKPGGAESFSRRSANTTIVAEPEPELSGEVIKLGEREALLPAEIAALLPGGAAPKGDSVVEFRFTIDDMTPEALAYLCEKCLAAGALEAYAIPAMMKKGRYGHEVTVLSGQDLAGLISDLIWRESSTFGMRVGERSRIILARDMRAVSVSGHKIRVKMGWLGGKIIRRTPEYEDCRAAALATGKPLGEIFALAERAAADLI